jgi:transcription elongation factor Elf1
VKLFYCQNCKDIVSVDVDDDINIEDSTFQATVTCENCGHKAYFNESYNFQSEGVYDTKYVDPYELLSNDIHDGIDDDLIVVFNGAEFSGKELYWRYSQGSWDDEIGHKIIYNQLKNNGKSIEDFALRVLLRSEYSCHFSCDVCSYTFKLRLSGYDKNVVQVCCPKCSAKDISTYTHTNDAITVNLEFKLFKYIGDITYPHHAEWEDIYWDVKNCSGRCEKCFSSSVEFLGFWGNDGRNFHFQCKNCSFKYCEKLES